VWEPMLPTDFTAPTTSVLSRASDSRVQQYWDTDHLVAVRMAADVRAPQPQHECCERSGILWDLVAVYPKGPLWDDRMPTASLFTAPVDEMVKPIGAARSGVAAK